MSWCVKLTIATIAPFCTFSGVVTVCIFFLWIYEINKCSDWQLINSRFSFRKYDENDRPTDQNKDVSFPIFLFSYSYRSVTNISDWSLPYSFNVYIEIFIYRNNRSEFSNWRFCGTRRPLQITLPVRCLNTLAPSALWSTSWKKC